MGRRAKIKPDQHSLIRIAATINLEQEPHFEFLKEFKGHGAIVREMLRLSLLGKKYEREIAQLARAHHEALIHGLARSTPGYERDDQLQNPMTERIVKTKLSEELASQPGEISPVALPQVSASKSQLSSKQESASPSLSPASGATKNFLA